MSVKLLSFWWCFWLFQQWQTETLQTNLGFSLKWLNTVPLSAACCLLFVFFGFLFLFFCHVPPQLVSDSLLEQERGGKRSRFLLPVISTAETWQSEAAQPKGRDESWILHGYTEKSVNDKKRIHDLIPLAPFWSFWKRRRVKKWPSTKTQWSLLTGRCLRLTNAFSIKQAPWTRPPLGN